MHAWLHLLIWKNRTGPNVCELVIDSRLSWHTVHAHGHAWSPTVEHTFTIKLCLFCCCLSCLLCMCAGIVLSKSVPIYIYIYIYFTIHLFSRKFALFRTPIFPVATMIIFSQFDILLLFLVGKIAARKSLVPEILLLCDHEGPRIDRLMSYIKGHGIVPMR